MNNEEKIPTAQSTRNRLSPSARGSPAAGKGGCLGPGEPGLGEEERVTSSAKVRV